MFRSKTVRLLGRLERKARDIATPDVRNWAEVSVNDVGRALSEYDRFRGTDDLAFALESAKGLVILLEELYRRAEPE